jgi:hypothetical protein
MALCNLQTEPKRTVPSGSSTHLVTCLLLQEHSKRRQDDCSSSSVDVSISTCVCMHRERIGMLTVKLQ